MPRLFYMNGPSGHHFLLCDTYYVELSITDKLRCIIMFNAFILLEVTSDPRGAEMHFFNLTRRNFEIPDFRMIIAMYLTNCRNNEIKCCISPRESLLKKWRHEFKKISGEAYVRRFCKICYAKNSKILDRATAKNCTKKVCISSPFLWNV